jgi:hypothetical protein
MGGYVLLVKEWWAGLYAMGWFSVSFEPSTLAFQALVFHRCVLITNGRSIGDLID